MPFTDKATGLHDTDDDDPETAWCTVQTCDKTSCRPRLLVPQLCSFVKITGNRSVVRIGYY